MASQLPPHVVMHEALGISYLSIYHLDVGLSVATTHCLLMGWLLSTHEIFILIYR